MNGNRGSGLLQVLLLGMVFILPLGVAAWLYFGGEGPFRPEGRTNHGLLLEPITNLNDVLHVGPAAELLGEHWLLVYQNADVCGEDCRQALYVQRQTRLMLGEDMRRVRRVFLHGEIAPDRVLLEEQFPGVAAIRDAALAAVLDEARPEGLPAGGYFFVDPLGNLVLYFPPDIAPGDMVDDMEHLLDLSRIG